MISGSPIQIYAKAKESSPQPIISTNLASFDSDLPTAHEVGYILIGVTSKVLTKDKCNFNNTNRKA